MSNLEESPPRGVCLADYVRDQYSGIQPTDQQFLDALRDSEHFDRVKCLLMKNPSYLPMFLQMLKEKCPLYFQAVVNNADEFLDLFRDKAQ